MSASPLVSVLIPARNAAPWIGEALESVLAQSWPAIEIIVSESGSQDQTLAVVQQYTSSTVTLLSEDSPASAAQNRNRAARAAQGEYLMFLDADDRIHRDKIRLQVERLAAEPECVASGEWGRFYGSALETVFVPETVWRDLEPEAWLIAAWTGAQPMMQPGLWLIPRAVAEQAGPWNEELTLIDDFEYVTRVVLASRGVRFCPGARLLYRSGNPSSLASVRSPEAWRSAWLAIDQGTRALLRQHDTPESRTACADMLQQLAFDAYLSDVATAERAQARAHELGGSALRMDGGLLFRAIRDLAGWKTAKRTKQALYGLGYGRLARLKEQALRGAGPL